MTLTTAQAIAQILYDAGIRYVFGQPGGEVVELIEALAVEGIEFVLMGHEAAAALAAGAVGQATGIPGVCLATLGPGAANFSLGLADAYLDRHPLIAISARTATDIQAWYNHQAIPLNEMFAPVTKASIQLDGFQTAVHLESAIDIAMTPPQGPVYLTLPGNLAALPDKSGGIIKFPTEYAYGSTTNALENIETALNGAKRPFVVVGISLDQAKDSAAVRHFLEVTGLPYADTPKTKGLVDPHSPNYLGTFLSASGDSHINTLIKTSDCILGIGYDPVETTYDWHLGDNYFVLADGPTGYGSFQPSVEAIGDVSEMLARLTERYDGQSAWSQAHFAAVREQVQAAIRPEVTHSEVGLAPLTIAEILRQQLPRNVTLTVDTGQHKMIFAQAWQTNRPLSYFNSNGLSAMSTAVPAAIGLSVINHEQLIVSIAGDGGFGMMVQELETVNRLGITPLFVVLCDQALSLIRIPQQMRGYGTRGAIEMAQVDWAQVAQGFGINGVWAHSAEELTTAVASWVDQPTATVIAVQTDEALYRGNSY